MSHPSTPPAGVSQPAGDPPEVDTPPTDPPVSEGTEANAEAARYRRRLRDVETERDGLNTRVEKMQRGQAERIVADRLAQPGDLFAFGVSLDDLRDDDGEIDEGLVETALFGILDQRPGLAKPVPSRRGPTVSGHHADKAGGGAGSWTSVLQGG